jgi:hypothetical protein
MTIVFSAILPQLIVMAVDSAVTLDFGNSREYRLGRKSYFYPGVGCVTTWGVRDANRIGDYLERLQISPGRHTVEDLADFVYQYLLQDYRPDQLGFDDVGYHVAGFDRQGRARLFHVFWGFDRPKSPEQAERKYEKYDHSPLPTEIQFLYNGRNDLAHVVVQTMLNQLTGGSETRFHLNDSVSIVCFADFVVRFGSELTPEVGPPFLTYLISPRNESAKIRNNQLYPVNRDAVIDELCNLGYAVQAARAG